MNFSHDGGTIAPVAGSGEVEQEDAADARGRTSAVFLTPMAEILCWGFEDEEGEGHR
jgi:hypothetical protein